MRRHRQRQKHSDKSRSRRQDGRSRRQRQRPKKIHWTDRVSEHFKKSDFIPSDLDKKEKVRISMGLVGGLELLRKRAGKRITILKGFITQEMAEKEGNWKRNYHPLGLAAEITIKDMSPETAFLLAEEIEEFKGIGLDLDKQCIHVDTRKETDRVSWVIKDGKEISLDDDQRKTFLGAFITLLSESDTDSDDTA